MKAIGIDIGTTSICGVLVNCQTETIERTINKNSNAFIETKNQWEKIQDTEKLIRIAKEIIDELWCEEVKTIGVTGQMHGIVYYNEDGKAVSPLYTWQDARGKELYLKEQSYADFLGVPSGYGLVTDFYNRENGICPVDAVGFCTIADYLVMHLTGRKKPVIHISNAASFGRFDVEKGCFEVDFTENISSKYEIVGAYRSAAVSAALGDNQASVLGSLRSEDDILLNIGTGSQISLISSKIIKTEHTEVRPYTEGKYLLVGAAICGGRAYSMLERFFSDVVYAATGERISMYQIMDKMERIQGAHLYADTRFGGTRQNPELTGAITGITTENLTPGELRHAFLYGIIEELYGMYKEVGVVKSGLVGSGNGLRRNKALVLAAEELFGMNMKMPDHLEEAAFGAAICGMQAAGM